LITLWFASDTDRSGTPSAEFALTALRYDPLLGAKAVANSRA
jgi:hypothetical protein